MTVVVWAPDLMDRSRFSALALKTHVVFAPSLDALQDAGAEIAVADLGRAGALEALVASNAPRKIGYVSHVLEQEKDRATDAGVEVFNRSVFFARKVNDLTD